MLITWVSIGTIGDFEISARICPQSPKNVSVSFSEKFAHTERSDYRARREPTSSVTTTNDQEFDTLELFACV